MGLGKSVKDVAWDGLIRLSARGIELQVRERRDWTMAILRAFGVEAWVIHNLFPVIGGMKGCPRCIMQSDVQLANIPENSHRNGPMVRELVGLCRCNKFVP